MKKISGLSLIFSVIIFILFVVVASAIGFGVGDYIYYKGRIIPGSFIGKVDVSGLTPKDANKLLKSKNIDQILVSPVVLFYNKESFEFKPSDIDAGIDTEKSVQACYSVSRSKNYIDLLIFRFSKQKTSVTEGIFYDNDKLLSIVKFVASELYSTPKDAKFVIKRKDVVDVSVSKVGVVVDIWKTFSDIDKGLKDGAPYVQINASIAEPKIKTEDLKKFLPMNLMGTYKTYYGTHDSPNRIHNIALIAKFLDNVVVEEGETFSLLAHIGDFTQERGFKEAYVIVEGALEAQYGGGTCQIATTLFNAVSFAGLNVIARRNHSMWFSIYPLGRDATVYPPYTDFKFINDSGHRVVIQAIATKKSLTFNILGRPTGKKVAFSNPDVRYFYGYATDEATGELKKTRLKPFRTSVVMTVKKNGKIIDETVYKSFYKLNGDRDTVKIKKKESF